ncbi:tautomerase family protein [Halioxenophilus sp. WMMB6]|uniref:tautomerase family protein n=1 Tax=Halioxenophilus sp. WMMB6 TaxID=3073815 RepID=UPI00295EFF05|nr:tautomerase family protein [Halioxenophilus sp. WMMB6]
MPIIEMHLLAGRSTEAKGRAAQAITSAAAEALGVAPETVRILITEHAKDEFYVAGKAGRASDQLRAVESSGDE